MPKARSNASLALRACVAEKPADLVLLGVDEEGIPLLLPEDFVVSDDEGTVHAVGDDLEAIRTPIDDIVRSTGPQLSADCFAPC